MLRLTEIRLPIDHDESALRQMICQTLGLAPDQLLGYQIRRRGYDARKGEDIRFVYTLDVEATDEDGLLRRFRGSRHIGPAPDETYRYPLHAPDGTRARPVIVGAGPCGLFAALSLARMGLRPLLLERGRPVRQRTADVWGFWRRRVLQPESNVQFGEGGAGTFSDGKLYSGIKDRGHHMRRILQDLVDCGAPPEILYISKPHVGTLRLVKVVEALREAIHTLGGEVRFEAHVTGLIIDSNRVLGVRLENGAEIGADALVLALGHSARDTFEMLHGAGVPIEPKAFSIGFRIEHPQTVIDAARLGRAAHHPALGAADYKLVHHCRNARSVYSFCMCPGGQVVAASSESGRVVTNGMSHYSRADRNANAGIVVGITPADFADGIEARAARQGWRGGGFGSAHPLAGIALQRELEARAFTLGGGNYNAPVQRVGDFLAGRPSTGPGQVVPSYTPGVTWTDLSSALPDYAIEAIREAIPAFERQLRGFAMDDAVLTGTETRTSSPIRLARDERTFESPSLRGLYPAGEGAGYAGGIMSAAVDGMKVAEAVARALASHATLSGSEAVT